MAQISNGIKALGRATTFVRRLGRHHFAYLRSIANGLEPVESARRYLGIEHGHQAKTAHQQVVDSVRALARRRGDPAWRLVGITIRTAASAQSVSLEDFVAERGLDGWSEAEVAEMYAEAFPADPRATRRGRLRERQLTLLRTLEGSAAETPSPTDLLAGWFDDVTAGKLVGAGMLTLADLGARIAAGGRWFRTLPAIGQTKAARIESHLLVLLPEQSLEAQRKPVFGLVMTPPLFRVSHGKQEFHQVVAGPSEGALHSRIAVSHGKQIEAQTDPEAVEAWIRARASSPATARSYRREAHRLLLWLQYEREGCSLDQMTQDDCLAFRDFLQDIPAKWQSRSWASPGTLGWAPFRGPLSHASRQQTVVIVRALFTYLQAVGYLANNPWVPVKKNTGDDPEATPLDTKALSEGAYKEVLSYVEASIPSSSRNRIRFILRFVEATGLRSSELLQARLKDFRLEQEGWMMGVHGKGARNRIVAVPGQAYLAIQDYLDSRMLGDLQTAPGDAPLVASTLDPMEPIGYQALYETVKGWIAKAVAASALPSAERSKLAGATTHWLRHTFGTRAVAREVPLDVIQAQLGHASIQTTMSIYGRAPIRRRAEELAKAFG